MDLFNNILFLLYNNMEDYTIFVQVIILMLCCSCLSIMMNINLFDELGKCMYADIDNNPTPKPAPKRMV